MRPSLPWVSRADISGISALWCRTRFRCRDRALALLIPGRPSGCPAIDAKQNVVVIQAATRNIMARGRLRDPESLLAQRFARCYMIGAGHGLMLRPDPLVISDETSIGKRLKLLQTGDYLDCETDHGRMNRGVVAIDTNLMITR